MDSFPAFDLVGKKAPPALTKRQQPILAIPTTYLGLNSGPKPAILTAIVLGSIVGFLLILSLVYAIANFGSGIFSRRTTVIEEEVVRKSRNSSAPSRRRQRVYEEDIRFERRSGGHASARTRETTRGNVEGDDISIP